MAASFLRPSTFGAQDNSYLTARFPNQGWPAKLAAKWLLDLREMRKIEQFILHGDDETVMAFKSSQIGAVGMTAVASAIISQLSSTTLQIPALSSVNWTASAFIIAALLFSILATMLSCIQQQILSTLNEPGGVRMWLSNGSARASRNAFVHGQDRHGLQTSVASVMLLRLPNGFLLSAVASFLIGFGLFLGFAWRQDLDNTPSRDSNLAVMVMYIVVGCLSFLGTAGVVKWKMGEVDHAEKEMGKDIEEGDEDDEDGAGGNGAKSQEDGRGDEGESDSLLGKNKKKRQNGTFSKKEVLHHEQIAKALEAAARAHRDLAKLMSDAIQES